MSPESIKIICETVTTIVVAICVAYVLGKLLGGD